MRRCVSIGMAALIAASTLAIAPAAEARDGVRRGHAAHQGRAYRARRGNGNAAAAAAAVGVAGALIGGAIAARESRRYDDGYYGRPYGYGGAPYGYYGY